MNDIEFTLDPTSYETLAGALKADARDVKLIVFSTPTSGTLTTKDVTLGFAYNNPTLVVTVLSKNSFLAKHANESTVEGHIKDFLIGYLTSGKQLNLPLSENK